MHTAYRAPESMQPQSAAGWHPLTRVAFRFAFLYWVIYLLPSAGAVSLLDVVPWIGDKLSIVLGWPLRALAPWIGQHVFHLTGEGSTWHPTGSGDTAMNYMVFVIGAVVALVGAAVWSAVGAVSEAQAKRSEYSTAYAWLRLILRFTLAVTLLDYGFAKIFPAQFGPLGDYGLTESYGDSTPMHLLWTFMGQSRAYMFFGGLMEVVPGALLLFRRTSTAGLLGAAAVLVNVVMLNFCYDVSVKLYSLHLLFMALFLLLPDARPIWRFLVERKEAALSGVWVPRLERKPLRVGAYVLQAFVVLSALFNVVLSSLEESRLRAKVSPLQGLYAVEGATGFGAKEQWVQAFFDDRYGEHYFGLVGQNKQTSRLPVTFDVATQTMNVTDKDSPASFHWSTQSADELLLVGTLKGVPASLHLHRRSPRTFTLNTPSFHWVTERSLNH